ncbi:MAG: hypothetical protein FRX49_00997 [Trebouxia sp. A1-2]|nr:MAG: hypothetical protein FRX49_00997 [Trebouxia sp. A1-2]
MDHIVTLLSDQLILSCTVWPKDTRIPAVQLVCRHWHNAAKPSIKHIPLTQGNDFELGLLLIKFAAAQSLRVRFQGLTGRTLAALRNHTNLRRLDLAVNDLDDHHDKLLVKAVFTLTHLEKLKLDIGPLGDSNLSAFAWAGMAKLQQLELKKLQIAVVDNDTLISAHLMDDSVDIYQPSVDVLGLHKSISFSLWCMTV